MTYLLPPWITGAPWRPGVTCARCHSAKVPAPGLLCRFCAAWERSRRDRDPEVPAPGPDDKAA
jgi:hypothetical protein